MSGSLEEGFEIAKISNRDQVGITNKRNKWANTDPRITGTGIRCFGVVSILCWDQVLRRSKHPLLGSGA
jgi:hypothetical protein